MTIYYYANHVYQFSPVMPLYHEISGTFIIKNRLSRKIEFYRFLRNTNPFLNEKTLFHTPKMILRTIPDFLDLEGIIFSQYVLKLHYNPKKCKTIFIGHGTGDKKYENDPNDLKSYNYHFITGPKHLKKLNDVGINIPSENLIKIGNMQFDDYVNDKLDSREKILDNLGVVDRNRKNVLYAPTWRYGKGTLKTHVYKFCKEITNKFNLIIRPHFFGSQHIPKIKLWTKLNRIKHVYFSNPANLKRNNIMCDFKISDILISDTSSILYEYLITCKPIIVVKNDYNKLLHNMPDEMNIMKAVYIYGNSDQEISKLIKDALVQHKYKQVYKDMLNHCFYFNDGKSVERAIRFLESISDN